ncbi:hypothetical protein JMUB7542_27790 [Staphylococcus aureus]
MVVAVDMMVKYEIPLSIENLKVDDSIWRSMLEHESIHMIDLSLIHISEPTRLALISYAVFCLKKDA